MEANISMPSMVLVSGLAIFRESAAAPEIAGRYKPLAIAFDPEGLPVDQGVSLNCGIRVQNAPAVNSLFGHRLISSR